MIAREPTSRVTARKPDDDFGSVTTEVKSVKDVNYCAMVDGFQISFRKAFEIKKPSANKFAHHEFAFFSLHFDRRFAVETLRACEANRARRCDKKLVQNQIRKTCDG